MRFFLFGILAHGCRPILTTLRFVCDVRVGSNSEVAAIANHVCSTPNNRHLRLHRRADSSCQFFTNLFAPVRAQGISANPSIAFASRGVGLSGPSVIVRQT